MITVPIHNREGKEIDSLEVDEAVLGGRVRHALLKQAIVMYHANQRVGTAATKSRGMVVGSTKKIYRQKGTGNARMGNARTVIRRGGGVAFAKSARDFGKDMPKKQRRLARDSALLAKLKSGKVVVVDELKFDKPKTKDVITLLANLKIDRSCLLTVAKQDDNLYKSVRNVPKTAVLAVNMLNAGDICKMQKVLFTKDAFLEAVNKVDKKQD